MLHKRAHNGPHMSYINVYIYIYIERERYISLPHPHGMHAWSASMHANTSRSMHAACSLQQQRPAACRSRKGSPFCSNKTYANRSLQQTHERHNRKNMQTTLHRSPEQHWGQPGKQHQYYKTCCSIRNVTSESNSKTNSSSNHHTPQVLQGASGEQQQHSVAPARQQHNSSSENHYKSPAHTTTSLRGEHWTFGGREAYR